MTPDGRRDYVQLKLGCARRKLTEAAQSGTLDLTASLALQMAIDALAQQDFATARTGLAAAFRGCRSRWYRGAIVDAITDIREAGEVAAQPVGAD